MDTSRIIEQGTVSHATMLAEDLIPAFMDELERIKDAIATMGAGDELERVEFSTRIDNLLAAIEQHRSAAEDEEAYYNNEEADYDLEDLFNLLDSLAPEGMYFGAIEGDGSDYGFWSVEPEDD